MRSFLKVALTTLAILTSGGPSTRAEGDADLVRDPTLQRSFFWQRTEPAKPRPRVRVAPVQPRRASASTVTGHVNPAKSDASRIVMVLGDSLAELLAAGLDDALADRPDIAVSRRISPESGLVRADVQDWPKVAREIVSGDRKPSLAVMHLGTNDRQALRDGANQVEPLSERWKELYLARVDAVAAAFAEKQVPLIWVGAPPVRFAKLSADLLALNEIFRQRVERAGGIYVDLWGGFVDAENNYTVSGPDMTGEIARLRAADGVHYTRAGARKAAHFVDVMVRRVLENQAPANLVALPVIGEPDPALGRDLQPGGIERLIDAMVSGLPDATALASIPVKPLAGPVLPLHMPLKPGAVPPSAGETQLLVRAALARGRGEASALLDRVFADGAPPEAKPGRADDHAWPRAAGTR